MRSTEGTRGAGEPSSKTVHSDDNQVGAECCEGLIIRIIHRVACGSS